MIGRQDRPAGTARGVACGTEKGGFVATVADVRVDGRTIVPLRLVTAFECGAIVHPDNLKNQVEGCLVQGLGGALFEAIHFDQGRITNPRFSAYRVPRFGDVPELVTEVMSELEPIIRRSSLKVTARMARNLRPLKSDRQKVKQVVLNLLSNALKFTPRGAVTISASYDDKKRWIAIAVKDTGDGGPDDFVHTENLVLADTRGRLRGFYDGTNPTEVDQAIEDIAKLLDE